MPTANTDLILTTILNYHMHITVKHIMIAYCKAHNDCMSRYDKWKWLCAELLCTLSVQS